MATTAAASAPPNELSTELIKFLDVVDSRKGKALTQAQKRQHPTQVAKEAEDSGFVEPAGAASAYVLTNDGREALLANLSLEERDARLAQWKEDQDASLAEFVTIVQQRNGRPLTRAQLNRVAVGVIEEAVSRGFVAEQSKPDCYVLKPAAHRFQFARLPVDQQQKRLQQLRQDYESALAALVDRIDSDLKALSTVSDSSITAATDGLRIQAEEALGQLDSVVKDVGAVSRVSEVAQKARESVAKAAKEFETRLTKSASAVTKAVEQQRDSLNRLRDEVEEKREVLHSAQSALPTEPTHGQPDPTHLLQVTLEAYDRLARSDPASGGVVKIPDLYDAVLRRGEELTLKQFHQLLLGWEEDKRFILEVCNDPYLERRADEGILTGRGLLFYIFPNE